MTPAYPQWPGFPLPFTRRRRDALPLITPVEMEVADQGVDVPDHHTQLEDLLGHVRRCERWARLDDRIDLNWRLGGNR